MAETEEKPTLILICGSPRTTGYSARLMNFAAEGAEKAGVNVEKCFVADYSITPCHGCDSCMVTGECIYTGEDTDDFDLVEEYLEEGDGAMLFAPLYFAGPPAMLKCLYDRFQPYWVRRYVHKEEFPPKRPLQQFIIGAGNDPFGAEPFVAITKSAFNVFGFKTEAVHDFIGYGQPEFYERSTEMEQKAYQAGFDFAQQLLAAKE